MGDDRTRRVEQLYQMAIDLPRHERALFLDKANVIARPIFGMFLVRNLNRIARNDVAVLLQDEEVAALGQP